MPEQCGWTVVTGCPAVTPRADCQEHLVELKALRSEQVLVAWWPFRVGAAFEHPVIDEPVEPLSKDFSGDPQVALEGIEAQYAQIDVAHDQGRPRLADGVERPR